MKILANDGLDQSGIDALTEKGFEVITTKVPQEFLADFINGHQIRTLLVRSATEVRKDLIDACQSLDIIGRGGVGMDNIDVDYARSKNIHVINTPAASSASVAELVFAHLFSGARFLQDSNRKMPLVGDTQFNKLKKSYEKGMELRGKTIGIVGMGRIGQEVARIALGLGMRVIAADNNIGRASIKVKFYNNQFINVDIETEPLGDVLKHADFITLHVPAQKDGCMIGAAEFIKMKNGAVIVNCSRGGVIDEQALIDALDCGKIAFAGLDVFTNEPTPSKEILNHPKISLTPHTGASTVEAQDRIGLSLAEQICSILQTY
ncbi:MULTISPECIES: D-2-hydroxyacid dehydrogenase [unclassified Kaistella]|uniref:D-2-hydroxyacid dehydrogenase n=1 Tax=unclassified Kaistella TaxID=2762626 RepID=UPI00273754A1|nr:MULTISPECIES: D-2-hydroxyacid dehydrogenase [unclassified Kaistella]MDP2453384.1 D-2-hydroxyacid dehydrogenase [Kaistella sp. SH11-4b]MDP2456441.1 D-2-hydroxyacid dehydrogenase [Kaistella sp. SH40-3]MDP2459197.1 D-2-hydroxyacid dehydrogenase [Kaistella sp. SH19-2b]